MSDINVTPGTICGCECGCRTPLTQGNVMGEDVTGDQPWDVNEDAPRILLLICAECYTGNHNPRKDNA